MAVVYSQYTSLYVLTNVTTQGTCLLSYSFSLECPSSQRGSYLRQAREAFAIGLLTKTEGDLVTSQQELHTFLKAAYSITVVQKWLGTPREVVAKAAEICQKGLEKFYNYCHVGTQKKDGLSAEVMHLIAQVKLLLGVGPLPNSDKGSFIPDSYRSVKDSSVHFTLEGFSKIMQRFQKYHATLCKTTTRSCKGTKDETDGAKVCLTAVGTTIGTLSTEGAKPNPTQKSELCKSKDNLDSSWQKISLSSSGSPRPSSSGYTGSIPTGHAAAANDQSCILTEGYEDMSDGLFKSPVKNKKQNPQGCNPGFSSYATSASAIPVTSSKAQNDSEAGKETVDTDLDWMDDVVIAQNQSDVKDAVQSLSQLTLKTLSSSLGDSFGSQSSWEKISDEHNSPMNTKPQPSHLPKAGTIQGHKSPDSDESFFVMETLDLETDDLAHVTYKNHKSAQVVKASPKPQPLQSRDVYPDTELETDSVPAKPATSKASVAPRKQSQAVPNQYEATETSTESSFELLEVEENQNGNQPNSVTSTENKKVPEMNPLCYSCLNSSKVAVQQFLLSQQDYQALLAGVCHDCLLRRLCSDKRKFQLSEHQTAYSALHLKFSKATGLWTARETCVYIGELMGLKGKQRAAIWVQFLHQEERLSSYVGKDYLEPRGIQFHLKDVERQMTAQYYVTQFNKSLYDKDDMAQIFFIPSEALLILNGDEIVGCVTVEPYMLGDFVKLTNNAGVKDMRFKATDYGLAFGHFTYQFSDGEEVVVDLQGWVTANGKGLTYLTDPQIHSTRTPKGPANFADRGLRYFLEEQHGPECNEICRLLKLRPFPTRPCVLP